MEVKRVEIIMGNWTGDIWVSLYRGTDEAIKRTYYNPRPENIKRLTQAINKTCIVKLQPDGKSLYVTAERLHWKPDKPYDWDWVERWRVAQPLWYEHAANYDLEQTILYHKAAIRAIGGMIAMLDREKAIYERVKAINVAQVTAIYQALIALDEFHMAPKAIEILQNAMFSSTPPDAATSEDIKDGDK